MIVVKEVIGHVEDIENDSPIRDYVELEWEQLNKRRIRINTLKNRELAIMLNDNISLTSGDLLLQDDELELVVRTVKEKAIVIYPKNSLEMGKVCYQLGNRHLPCLIDKDQIMLRYDQTLIPVLEEVGVRYEETKRRFIHPFKQQGHHH